jgi:hypothetical protein
MPGRSESGIPSNYPASIAGLVYLGVHTGVKYAFENCRGRRALVFEFCLGDLDGVGTHLPDEDFIKGLWERGDSRVANEHRLSDGGFDVTQYPELWKSSLREYGCIAIDGVLPIRLATRIALFDRTRSAGSWLDTNGGLNLNVDTVDALEPFFAASTNLYFNGEPMPPEMLDLIDGSWYSEGARAAFLSEWGEALRRRPVETLLRRPSEGWDAADIRSAVAKVLTSSH